MDAQTIARDGKTAGTSRTRSLDITVLLGGPSTEREVSLVSGTAISDALVRNGHRVTPSDISPQDVSALDRKGIDLVFIALHGQFGESGQVQQLCEERGLRYIGSPPRASELAMDKAASKQYFRQAGLITADWLLIEESDDPRQYRLSLEKLGLPAVLKPVDGGSSVDLSIAQTAGERDAALEGLLDKYGRAMVENYVKGREFTVGLLGEMVLPVLQIIPKGGVYDKFAKYDDNAGTEYTFNHGLSAEQITTMQRAARTAFTCLGCRDLSRVDFILSDAGVPHVLEINTIPGFTGHSLLPMAAARAGIPFDDLVERIVEMAMKR